MDVLLQAFMLGAVGGVIPGAVLTILLVSTLQGGLKAALRAFVWALISEIVIAGALLITAVQLGLSQEVFRWIALVGGLVLMYFAWQVFHLRSVTVKDEVILFSPTKIFLLSATNAPLYVFWTTVCFPLIWKLSESWGLTLAATSYFFLFEIGWAITTFMMVLVFVFSRKTLTNEKVMRFVFTGIALILAGFGIRMLADFVQYIL